MKNRLGLGAVLVAAVMFAQPASSQNVLKKMQARKELVKTMPETALISASSAKGSPAFHPHLVRAGAATTYLLRLSNAEAQEVAIDLALSGLSAGWGAKLEKTSLKLGAGQTAYVRLDLSAPAKSAAGSSGTITVKAMTSSGNSGEVVLQAEVTDKHKTYYVSIDSFGPEYLALNSKGNGLGREGDWLTPNVHKLIDEGAFFPGHRAHLVSATDMNHAAFLSGAYPGRLGIYSVNIFLFGFDEKGNPVLKATPVDLMYYGKDGKPVTNIFNVVKDPAFGGNPHAFTAYVSGKNWVPQHYLNPVFGLDRIATVSNFPEYVAPAADTGTVGGQVKQTLSIQLRKFRDNQAFLWEDPYAIDQAIEVINNEDPDVCYILLGATDAAGHLYGAAWDLDEWNTKGTPDDLSDDVSRVNRRGNRLGQVNTVRTADKQLGRFIAFLKERGTYDDSYIVLESDHNMETNFFAGAKLEEIMGKAGYSQKKDYFVFTVSQIGALFARPGNHAPQMIPDLEKALESCRMKNPLTGVMECPLVAFDREEMKTGIDKATGERFSPPGELYSEFYIENPKTGGLSWPDIMLFAKKNYQFPLYGVGLASVGLGKLDIPLPKINIFVGGHGGQSTQNALLSMRGPGIPGRQSLDYPSYSSDVAPTLYALEGYKAPDSVQGRVLPVH